MKKVNMAVLLCAAVSLSSCETTGPKQQTGTVIGAVAGGLIGSQFGDGGGSIAAGALGAVVGGLVGGSIGAQLDAQDRARLQQITTASIRSGQSKSFRNSKTGVSGKTKVIRESNAGGKQCRTVQQNVTLANGQVSQDTVTGCKGANGWSV
ncbi:glycine zipper 2TM domain-containing protein [Ensifer adhaerens]|uniref:glycine zipper 2TM domain-containing protein n=1 Tax=Ensifer adhaerens TaxID=106592 RepID=UPI000CF131F8|nr:glycine zipper 2TM domain-containing protein [Ensifer adhaerens]